MTCTKVDRNYRLKMNLSSHFHISYLPITTSLRVQLCSSVSLCTGHLYWYLYDEPPWICSVEQMQALSTGSGMQFVSGSLSTCTKLESNDNIILCAVVLHCIVVNKTTMIVANIHWTSMDVQWRADTSIFYFLSSVDGLWLFNSLQTHLNFWNWEKSTKHSLTTVNARMHTMIKLDCVFFWIFFIRELVDSLCRNGLNAQ